MLIIFILRYKISLKPYLSYMTVFLIVELLHVASHPIHPVMYCVVELVAVFHLCPF